MAKRKKNWNSLTDLRDFIVKNEKDEFVLKFDGMSLTTNKNVYTMDYDGLITRPNNEYLCVGSSPRRGRKAAV
jgi:hypothetical protein